MINGYNQTTDHTIIIENIQLLNVRNLSIPSNYNNLRIYYTLQSTDSGNSELHYRFIEFTRV